MKAFRIFFEHQLFCGIPWFTALAWTGAHVFDKKKTPNTTSTFASAHRSIHMYFKTIWTKRNCLLHFSMYFTLNGVSIQSKRHSFLSAIQLCTRIDVLLLTLFYFDNGNCAFAARCLDSKNGSLIFIQSKKILSHYLFYSFTVWLFVVHLFG